MYSHLVRISALLLLVAGVGSAAQAQSYDSPRFYVQPSFIGVVFGGSLKDPTYGQYASIDGVRVPVGGAYKDTVGGSIAFGANLAPNQAIEADINYFDASSRGFPLDKVEFTQTLVAYKYRIPFSAAWSMQVGAAVGSTHESGRQVSTLFQGYIPSPAYHYSADVFTGGGVAEMNYRLTRSSGIVLGTQVLGVGRSLMVSSGVAVLFSAGLNFRF